MAEQIAKKKKNKRLRITDEEALEELKRYEDEINLVTCEARKFYWIPQFTILVLALFLIYISVFIATPPTKNSTVTLVPQSNQKRIIFLFFFGGFYQSQQNTLSLENISSSANWPFFVLLVLLIIEKFCT